MKLFFKISDNGHCVFFFGFDGVEGLFKEGTEVEFVLSSVEKDNVFHVIPYEWRTGRSG